MLSASLGVQIHLVNIQGLFQQVLANPANFGFTNVTGSAINSSLNGNGYLFWDQRASHHGRRRDHCGSGVSIGPSMLLVLGVAGAAGIWMRSRGRIASCRRLMRLKSD